MKKTHYRKRHQRKFTPGKSVCAKNFGPGIKWLIGTIIRVTGPVSYAVALHDRRVCRRHVNHLRSCRADSDSTIHNDTEIAPPNSYKPFRLVLLNRETEVVASIPDASVTSVAPETTDVERDNVVTETRDIACPLPHLICHVLLHLLERQASRV